MSETNYSSPNKSEINPMRRGLGTPVKKGSQKAKKSQGVNPYSQFFRNIASQYTPRSIAKNLFGVAPCVGPKNGHQSTNDDYANGNLLSFATSSGASASPTKIGGKITLIMPKRGILKITVPEYMRRKRSLILRLPALKKKDN
jgi:hypothetical protein